MELQEFVNKCSVEDGVIKMPNIQLDRSDYLKVKKLMESNGAKWKGGEEDGMVYPARCDQRTYSRLSGNTTRVYFEGEDLRIK